MKYCKKCGKMIDDDAIFCSVCGARTNGDDSGRYAYNTYSNMYGNGGAVNQNAKGSVLLTIIGLLFWQVGFIVWIFTRHTRPAIAKSALKGALGGLTLNLPVFGLVMWIFWKDDPANRDIAKMCGICAIIGAVLCIISIVFAGALRLAGVSLIYEIAEGAGGGLVTIPGIAPGDM